MQQPIIAVYVLWLVWFLSWIGAALLTSGAKRLNIAQDVLYRTMIIVGAVTLLFGFLFDPGFDVRNKLWMPLSGLNGWLVVALLTVCFCFAWWARICLGFQLPGSAHKPQPFCEKGPYRWIRHPIYAALIVGGFATALLFGRPSSLVGAGVMAVAFLFKIGVEETSLRRELGSFDDYAERVSMLLPLPHFRRARAPAKWADEAAPAINLLAQAMAAPAAAAAGPTITLPLAPSVEPAVAPAPAIAPVLAASVEPAEPAAIEPAIAPVPAVSVEPAEPAAIEPAIAPAASVEPAAPEADKADALAEATSELDAAAEELADDAPVPPATQLVLALPEDEEAEADAETDSEHTG